MKKSYNELKTLINKLGYENPEVVKYAHDLEEQERKDWEGKAPVRKRQHIRRQKEHEEER